MQNLPPFNEHAKNLHQNHICKFQFQFQQIRYLWEFTPPPASRAPSIRVEHLKIRFLCWKMLSRPGFFKFYIPSLGEENQKIPPAFIQSIKAKWPMNVALRDRYNNLWCVRVEQVGGYCYFKDGWTKFLEENRVEGGDMLVYEYFSKGLFDFKVHGRETGCMTRGAGGPKPELQNIKIEPYDDGVSDDESDYESIYEEEQGVDDDTDDNDDPTTEEKNRVDDHPQVEQVKNEEDQEITPQEGRRDDNPQPELVRGGTTSTSKRKMKRDLDWFGVEIFRTGLIPKPKNCYFVTKKKKHRAGELYIPMDVIKGYNLKLPEEVLLLDPHGRKFRAKRKMWADERTFYVGGWKPLCRANAVGDEDSCICEFVQNDDGFCISVSFYPPKRQQK